MENAVSESELKIEAYRAVCAKLGIVMCVYYICRILAGFVIFYFIDETGIAQGSVVQYTLRSAAMVLFVYVLPMAASAMLFDSFRYYRHPPEKLRQLYKKPKRLAQNLGNFPAMYGLGQSVNLLTMLAFFLIMQVFSRMGGGVELERFFDQVAVETPQNLISALIMVFMIVFIAPIAEEFWARGIMYDALKPYGCGMAILISSILFGLLHGRFEMLPYTTALGLALGYIRYATDSLLVVTLLHMIFNAIAAGMLFLLSLAEITGGENNLIDTLSNIYLLAMLVMVVIGIAAFIKKIPKLKRYRITNDWDEVSSMKKLALFFVSMPVILMLVLAFDTHANHLLLWNLLT